MKKILLSTLIAVLALGTLSTVKSFATGPVTVTIQPTADESKETYITPYCGDVNQGGNRLYLYDDGNWEARNLLQFDLSLIPGGSTITSSELYLYTLFGYSDSHSASLVAHRLMKDWVEGDGAMWCMGNPDTLGGATWQNASSGNPWTTPGGDYDAVAEDSENVGASYTWYDWNLTSLTQKWHDGTVPNYGVILVPESGFTYFKWFASAERDQSNNPNSPNRPKLVVTYDPEDIAPVTTISLSGTMGDNNWYTSDVQVTLTAADSGGSGLDKTEFSYDGMSWNTYSGTFSVSSEGVNSLYYRSVDKAGNVEAANLETIKIDKTAPIIILNTPSDGDVYFLNQVVLADWSANDAVSGICSASGTVPNGNQIDTATPGAKIFTVKAEDMAGNKVGQTVTYYVQYDFGGFLPPIVSGKEYKINRTIPVKFQLKDAEGNYVANAVAKLYLVDNGGNVFEAESAGKSSTGNLFRYDPVDNQYIFNLKTKGLAAGDWELLVKLDDGTTQSIMIVLK